MSCLETDRKGRAVLLLTHVFPSPPPQILPSLFTSVWPTRLCLLSFLTSGALSLSSLLTASPSRPPIHCCRCLGNRLCTQTRALSLYSQLFIVSTLSFAQYETPALGRTRLPASLPPQTSDLRLVPPCLPVCDRAPITDAAWN